MVKKVICLDAGCGTDRSYGFNPRCPKTSESIFLDVEEPSREVAKLVSNTSTAHFVVASVELLPFRDGAFHLVYAHHVLEHTVNILGASREIVRVLRPKGQASIVVPNFLSINATKDPEHRHILNPYKVWKLFKKAGCKHVVFLHRPGSRIPKPLRLVLLIVFSFLSEEVAVVCVR